MESEAQQTTSHFRHGLQGHTSGVFSEKTSKTSKWSEALGKTASGAVKGETSDALERMTTIQNMEIMKGLPVHLAMGAFGRLFAVHGDPEEHMAMSRRVSKLQDFISHNWVVPRHTKWACLALHYNVKPAWTGALATSVLLSVLVLLGALPPLNFGPAHWTNNWAWLVGQLVFYVLLLFWQDIKRRLPASLRLQERMVFVDRSCIHQTDREKMIEGIRNLAGFLRSSDCMVVCCGPTYFRKLWTVYEIASFLSIHRDPGRIKIYPTTWARPLAVFTLAFSGIILLIKVLLLVGFPGGPLFFVAMGPTLFVLTRSLRQTVRAHMAMREDLRRFDICEAHCAVESDRAVVQANVSIFMRELGRVPGHAQEEECLEAFNDLVHTEFLSSVSHSRTELSFLVLFQLSAGALPLFYFLDAATEIAAVNGDWIGGFARLLEHLEVLHCIVLVGNVCALPLLSRNLQLQGWRESLYLLFTALAAYLLLVPVAYLPVLVAGPAMGKPEGHHWTAAERWRSVLLTIAVQAGLFGLTAWTSLRPCCRRREEELAVEPRPGVCVSV